MSTPRFPVFLLTGFLGSGKTTLINALLRDPAFADTALIVNELGAIGLDHLLFATAADNVRLLESGCLCCTIVDSLHETLADLNFRRVRGEIPAFARVIVETTGLADPGPILNTLLGHRLVTDFYRLEAVVVTVDSQHAAAEFDRHPEVAKQIAVADRLVLTKLDLVPLSAPLLARLDALNPAAMRLDGREPATASAAFAPGERHRLPVAAPGRYLAVAGGGPHDRGIRADSFVLPAPPSWAGVAAWWQLVSMRYGDRLLRCKGILQIADTDRIVFIQGVQRVFHAPETLAGWPDDDHRSRIVCITRDVDPDELRLSLDAFGLPAGMPPELSLADLKLERNLQ